MCKGRNNYRQTILTTITIEGEIGGKLEGQKQGVLRVGDEHKFIMTTGGVGRKGECVCTKSFWGKRFKEASLEVRGWEIKELEGTMGTCKNTHERMAKKRREGGKGKALKSEAERSRTQTKKYISQGTRAKKRQMGSGLCDEEVP